MNKEEETELELAVKELYSKIPKYEGNHIEFNKKTIGKIGDIDNTKYTLETIEHIYHQFHVMGLDVLNECVDSKYSVGRFLTDQIVKESKKLNQIYIKNRSIIEDKTIIDRMYSYLERAMSQSKNIKSIKEYYTKNIHKEDKK